jgi:site-specific recombinase XerD
MAGSGTTRGPPSPASLARTASDLLSAATAPSTARQYQRVWESFCRFVQPLALVSLPALPSTIALYIAKRVSSSPTPASATLYSEVSAISYMHKLHDLHDPTTSFSIRQILKGVAKLRPARDTRLPLTMPILQSLLKELPHVVPLYTATLFAAMFTTMFAAFFRLGEVTFSPHNLRLCQVLITPGAATITLNSFKHHNSRLPVTLQIPPSPSSSSCPVYHLQRYQSLRGITPGPFFCHQNGQPIHAYEFREVLDKVKARAGLSDSRITPHSFRIGAATYAAANGYSSQQIQAMGRWKSSAFQRYVRIPVLALPSRV